VLLAGLFELQLTRPAFDEDPDAEQIPIARISRGTIDELVVKLGGDPDAALFGAFADEWADDDAAVLE
jgi:hypothetical protein